ncbi:hypothetical protein NQ317_011973 [Molorchus minor]|uniref:Lachesin n=1 Tax=Molorchus minor TaxID=1323400 RepID=A0ABQ9ITY3_9CUCU|nr:hypothetical protein NQ317_011973 [Molorchus minor]
MVLELALRNILPFCPAPPPQHRIHGPFHNQSQVANSYNTTLKKVEVYNGSHLNFWRLDRRQMGAYLCIASNDIPPAVSKRISLSVNLIYDPREANKCRALDEGMMPDIFVTKATNTVLKPLKD